MASPVRARLVLSAATASNCPRCMRLAIAVGPMTMRPTDAGAVNATMARIPLLMSVVKRSGRFSETARASSGCNVVAIDTASRPCGSTKNMKASKYADAREEPGSARFRITTSATWLATTKPSVQPLNLATRRTAGCRRSKCHLSAMGPRNAAPVVMMAINAIPPVAPTARVRYRRELVEISDSFQVVEPASGSVSNVAMMTRFDATGAQAAARNRRDACNTAVITPVTP